MLATPADQPRVARAANTFAGYGWGFGPVAYPSFPTPGVARTGT
jgi:hypothetical protein